MRRGCERRLPWWGGAKAAAGGRGIGAKTHLPFGGAKQTGTGHREAAVTALDFYSEWKTVYVDYSDRLQRAQIDT